MGQRDIAHQKSAHHGTGTGVQRRSPLCRMLGVAPLRRLCFDVRGSALVERQTGGRSSLQCASRRYGLGDGIDAGGNLRADGTRGVAGASERDIRIPAQPLLCVCRQWPCGESCWRRLARSAVEGRRRRPRDAVRETSGERHLQRSQLSCLLGQFRTPQRTPRWGSASGPPSFVLPENAAVILRRFEPSPRAFEPGRVGSAMSLVSDRPASSTPAATASAAIQTTSGCGSA